MKKEYEYKGFKSTKEMQVVSGEIVKYNENITVDWEEIIMEKSAKQPKKRQYYKQTKKNFNLLKTKPRYLRKREKRIFKSMPTGISKID